MTDNAVARRPQAEPLTDAERAAGHAAARIDVAAAVWTLWDRIRKERDLDQQWLADRLGKSKSRVSRLLKGPGNWTLDTVGDLLEAMEASFTCVEAHTYKEIAQGKAWKATLTERPRTRVFVRTEIYAVEGDEPVPMLQAKSNGRRDLLIDETDTLRFSPARVFSADKFEEAEDV